MIFTILKVIGIILLILLGLALFMILSVLFVPLRYWGSGNFDNTDIHADIRASWFLHIFAFRLCYDKELDAYYRIAFIKRKLFEEYNDTESEKEYKADSFVHDSIDHDRKEVDRKEDVIETSDSGKESPDTDNTQKKEKCKKSGHTKKKHSDSIISKLNRAIKKFQKLYSDKKNKAAIGHLKNELFLILKRTCPKKLALTAEFSTGEPDTTGILLGLIAMFPIGYTNRWQITPDFESDNAFAKGNFKIQGRIFTVSIIAALLRILFDKNCRRLYNKIR